MSDDRDLAAGDFSSWLQGMQGVIAGDGGADVPCGGCTACCTSSQFISIAPDETDTLAHIPPELLFPAPRRPKGHVVLGYDERGHCPMLVDEKCTIYDHRPRTCRSYDCRIFPATGVAVDSDGGDKQRIATQAQRWQFTYPGAHDRSRHHAVEAAAAFLRTRGDEVDAAVVALNATQLAVLAIEIHGIFVGRDGETGDLAVTTPEPDAVRAEVLQRIGR